MHRLAFIHVPKTGGTSLTASLDELFDKDKIFPHQVPEKTPADIWHESKKYKFIRGHYTYQQVKEYFPEAKFITVIRDPVERELSFYFWLLHVDTINSALTRVKHQEQLEAANKGLEYYSKTQVTDGKLALQFSTVNNSNIRSLVESAKDNLAFNFYHVIIYDFFNEGFEKLSAKLEVRLNNYRQQVNPKKDLKNINANVINNIVQRVAIDLEIYSFIKNLCQR